MDSRLDIEIGINDAGNLYVYDNSYYERWIEGGNICLGHHLVIDRVIRWDVTQPDQYGYDKDPDSIEYAHVKDDPWLILNDISDIARIRAKEFTLTSDGLYQFQRMIIPDEDHLGTGDTCYYRDSKLYSNKNGVEKEITVSEAFEEIREVNTGNAFWYDEMIVSIYDLIKCYILTERQRILNWLRNNCKANCDTVSAIDSNSEFLLSAINVLTYLISKQQWADASRIINGMYTCSGLCKDVRKDLKGCGCGKSVY